MIEDKRALSFRSSCFFLLLCAGVALVGVPAASAQDTRGKSHENGGDSAPSQAEASDDVESSADEAEAKTPSQEVVAKPAYETLSLRGRVVWLAAALKAQFDISTVPEAAERILALQSKDGTLCPLVEDTRARAFRLDQRLRGIDVELLVRRYNRSPALQVLRVYTIKEDGKYRLDYWCDICSIVMFELGPCDCCQEPNRLRERKVP